MKYFFSIFCECVTLWKTLPKLLLCKSDLLFIKRNFFHHSGLIRASRRSWRECSRNGRKESSRPTRPSASSRLCMQGKLSCYKIFSLLVNLDQFDSCPRFNFWPFFFVGAELKNGWPVCSWLVFTFINRAGIMNF